MKTGIKFKGCNVGTAEAHNRRDRAYCEAVARKFGHTYFWDEYRHLNRSWRNPSYDKPLPELLEDMKVLVKQKTGRSMQCKPVTVTDRKTGKTHERSGCSAIREGCPPIKPDTRIEDFEPFVRWLNGYGINVISIDLHHDEGHADPDTDDLKQNHHAHIIVDWLDHSTGKTVKIDKEVCKEMQTVLAESLGMERGTPKEDTGIEGLSAIEYKEKMATAHVRKLKQKQEELESRNAELTREQENKETEIAELEVRRVEKQKALDAESGSALKNGLANIFGKGKYAEIERENTRLQSEIKTANIERDKALVKVGEMEEQVAQIPKLAEERALMVMAKKEILHEKEVKKLRKQHIDALSSLHSEYDALSNKYRSLESSSSMRIERLEQEKNDILARIKAMLDMLQEKLREAVKVLIEFSKSVLKDFSIRHRDTIVEYLSDSPDIRNAAQSIKVFARPFLDNRQFDKGSKELDRLTSNFPSVLEEVNRAESRGFRL
ncbi:hypothetical protein [Parabacteroides distasonis]|uniref:hypothetical protein n=1 Tax=Parabacteroides distasonis TaxID=823 RepID=UPI0028053E55|nr:hypothetical protein [Parabacteroides distasonis]WMI41429.1 hypothetical protein Q8809_15810 [Parabacteroides distasonis]